MASRIATDRIDADVRASYPYPLAATFYRAYRSTAEMAEVHDCLLDLAEIMLKYLASIMLAQYLQDGANDAKINHDLQHLARPSLGHWQGWLRDILDLYRREKRPLAVAELPDFYRRRHTADLLTAHNTLAQLMGKWYGREVANPTAAVVTTQQFFDLLIQYRNILAHGLRPNREQRERVAAILKPALRGLGAEMAFVAQYPLVYINAVTVDFSPGGAGAFRYAHRLTYLVGDRPEVSPALEMLNQAPARNKQLYLLAAQAEFYPLLSLHPFLIFRYCESCNAEQAFVLNSTDERALDYISYQCCHHFNPTEYVEDMRALLHDLSTPGWVAGSGNAAEPATQGSGAEDSAPDQPDGAAVNLPGAEEPVGGNAPYRVGRPAARQGRPTAPEESPGGDRPAVPVLAFPAGQGAAGQEALRLGVVEPQAAAETLAPDHAAVAAIPDPTTAVGRAAGPTGLGSGTPTGNPPAAGDTLSAGGARGAGDGVAGPWPRATPQRSLARSWPRPPVAVLVLAAALLVASVLMAGPFLAARETPPVRPTTPATTAAPPRATGGPSARTTPAAPAPPAVAIAPANAVHLVQFRRLLGHTDKVRSLAFAPDGQTIATAGDDLTVRAWRVADGRPLYTVQEHRVLALAFLPDGRTLVSATADQGVHFWRAADGTALAAPHVDLTGAAIFALAPDGAVLAADIGDSSNDGVRMWSTAGNDIVLHLLSGPTGAVRALAFAPDGRTLAAGADDTKVWRWQVADGSPLPPLEAHTAPVRALAFSRDGRTLASGADDGTVQLWQASDGIRLPSPTAMRGVRSLAFSPDGQVLASGEEDGTIRLWATADGKPLATLPGHVAAVDALAFAPDGQTLGSGAEDKTVILWRIGQ